MAEAASIPFKSAWVLLTQEAQALAQALRLLDHALTAGSASNSMPDSAAASAEMSSLRQRAEQLETLAATSVMNETTIDSLRDGMRDGIGLALETASRLGAEAPATPATQGRKGRSASARRRGAADALDAPDASALASMLRDELLKQRQTLDAL
jgi:hypothetical protein